MIKDHPTFIPPDNKEQLIWRYIDFTKFVDLLSTQELYFTRVDKLEDIFEGSNTIPTVENREAYFKYMVEIGEMTQEGAEKTKKILDKYHEEQRQHYAVNCWHMNNYESAAMWSLYAKEDAGIAIRSTYERLKNAFNESPIVLHIGKINYVDFFKDLTSWGIGFIPILLKGKSFEHEKELRAVIWSWEEQNKKYCEPFDFGIRVKINLDVLVESVFIAPHTQKWIRNLIESMMDKFEFCKPLHYSCLEGKPAY